MFMMYSPTHARTLDGFVDGSMDIYIDLNGGPDACTTGFIIGSTHLMFKDGQEGLHIEGNIYKDRDQTWYLRGFNGAGGIDGKLIKLELESGKPTFCARVRFGYPIPKKERQRLRGSFRLDNTSWPRLRFTINGDNVRIESFQACCSFDHTFIEELPWGKGKACPKGTRSAGKASGKFQCAPKTEASRYDPSTQTSLRACCYGEGQCDVTDEEECEDEMGGTFLEDVYFCLPKDPCQQIEPKRVKGACYLSCPNPRGKECIMTTQQTCKAIKGINFESDGQCPPFAYCPKETLGCCLPDEKICREVAATVEGKEECGMRDGYLLKLGDHCSDDFEACCTGPCIAGEEKKCNIWTKSFCDSVDGTFLGFGKKCPPKKSKKRACCDPINGKCDLKTKETCTGTLIFMKDRLTCRPNPCKKPDPPKGGCCDSNDGECKEVAENSCLEPNRFFPDGCPEECPLDQGACYLDCPNPMGKDCIMTTQQKCNSIKGINFESDGQCPPQTDCPEEIGCCVPGEGCYNGTLEDCKTLQGELLPPGQLCKGVDDPYCKDVIGACHIPCPVTTSIKICKMMTRTDCESIPGSEFLTDHKLCPPTICPETACNSCEGAVGSWTFSEKNMELTLEDNCTSRMEVDYIRQNGVWKCEPGDSTVNVLHPELNEISTFILVWEGNTPKLCYFGNNKELICGIRNPRVAVTHKETIQGQSKP